jgi:hypothetical protein
MGRRTLAAHTLEFHRRRHVDETCAPANLDGNGLDLLDVFYEWCSGLGGNELHDGENNLFVRMADARRSGRTVLASVEVGSWGEAGAVVDSTSGSIVMPLTEEQAPTGVTRAVMFVPTPGEVAVYFAEYSGRGSGGSRLLRAFRSFWSENYPITMIPSVVTEGEAWAEGADLKEVEVRFRRISSDIADAAQESKAVYSHAVRPPRGKFLKPDLLRQLQRHPNLAASTVGLGSQMPDDSEVLVTLKNREGRQKKFVLGHGEGLPSMREELNPPHEPALSDDALLILCADKASDILGRM